MEILDDLEFDTNLKFDFNYKDTSAKYLLEVNDVLIMEMMFITN
jgi:ATP-binding cassette subfamily F protein 3